MNCWQRWNMVFTKSHERTPSSLKKLLILLLCSLCPELTKVLALNLNASCPWKNTRHPRWSCATISKTSTVGLFCMRLGKCEKHRVKPNLYTASFKIRFDRYCAKVGMKSSFCLFWTAKYPETPLRSPLNPSSLFCEKAICF